MCSRVAGSVSFATGTWGPSGPPANIPTVFASHLNAPRLMDPNLLGHFMVVDSYTEYESRAILFGKTTFWSWKPLRSDVPEHPSTLLTHNIPLFPTESEPTHIFAPNGLAVKLRQRLFLTRETMPLFDTPRYVRNLEHGFELAYDKWETDYQKIRQRNKKEWEDTETSSPSQEDESMSPFEDRPSRCFRIQELDNGL
jgi:hypothetical protein